MRQALLEAKHTGIHLFCITIDTQTHDYLPQMHGHAGYTVESHFRELHRTNQKFNVNGDIL